MWGFVPEVHDLSLGQKHLQPGDMALECDSRKEAPGFGVPIRSQLLYPVGGSLSVPPFHHGKWENGYLLFCHGCYRQIRSAGKLQCPWWRKVIQQVEQLGKKVFFPET